MRHEPTTINFPTPFLRVGGVVVSSNKQQTTEASSIN